MKQKLLSASCILVISLLAGSCKLDPPIYPGEPGFVPYTSKGSPSTPSSTVDLTLLAGNWEVNAMYNEIYTTGNALTSSSPSPFKLYTGVEFNSASKNYLFSGSSNLPDPGTFTTSTVGPNTYIQLQQDPFNRSDNDKIQIVSLTANAMTWVAIDPQVLTTTSGSVKTGVKVVYTRIP